MKRNLTVHVIIINNGILYGHTMDTNSHYLAKEFSEISMNLVQISAIHDNKEKIKSEIINSTADIIITTGGLGPTKEDKTKYVLSEILNKPLEIHPDALRWTEEYFDKRGSDRDRKVFLKNQALVPVGTIPLCNKVGTAPGLWTVYGNQILINLPGVPFEMKYLMKNEVMPKLNDRFHPSFMAHEFVQILNITETKLRELLSSFSQNLPAHIEMSYLPRGEKIKIRLTGRGENKNELKKELRDLIIELNSHIPEDNFLSKDNSNIEINVGNSLLKHNLSISTAESFTSGKIASALSSVSGSSRYFKGGIVAYSPVLKNQLLKIPKELMKEKGVVNSEVALRMAKGAREITQCDVAISTTGVAGPGNDEFGVEPGVAFIAISSEKREIVHEFHYPHLDRKDFTQKLTEVALQKLYHFLKSLV